MSIHEGSIINQRNAQMTENDRIEAALQASEGIATNLTDIFFSSMISLPEEMIQQFLLQMTDTIWATSMSIAVSSICKSLNLSKEDSLRAHDEIIDNVCKLAKNGYKAMQEHKDLH